MLPRSTNLNDDWHPVEPRSPLRDRVLLTGSFSLPAILEIAGTFLNTFARSWVPVLEYVGAAMWLVGHASREPSIRKYYDTSLIAEAGRDAATWLIGILYIVRWN